MFESGFIQPLDSGIKVVRNLEYRLCGNGIEIQIVNHCELDANYVTRISLPDLTHRYPVQNDMQIFPQGRDIDLQISNV